MKTRIISAALLAGLIWLGGCADKVNDEYNKPAAYWYEKMVGSLSAGNLEKADGYYSSLQSEHVGSPLLKEATLMLAHAHMRHEEYLLTEHFLNEYVKRFATPREREYAEYLKVKAKYLGLPNARRDQGLIQDAIDAGETFKRTYADSAYFDMVDTMVTNLHIAQASLNESIALLYERLDKPKAAEYYRSIRPEPWIEWDGVRPADVAFYRSMFEGDGTDSWYAFLIPDTRSVIAKGR